MVEQVQEFDRWFSVLFPESDELFGVDRGQGAERAYQTYERGDELERFAGLLPVAGAIGIGNVEEVMDGTGRELQCELLDEMDDLPVKRAIMADRYTPRLDSPEQAHRLKEVKPERLLEEPVDQSRVRSPLRAGHLQFTSRCLLVATSWVKELILT